MKISIFGGAQPKPGEPAFEEAYFLGRCLAQSGHTILTGGYIGTMEAASRGAAEAGGHVIGVTCDEIENWRTVKPNPWVKEEWRFDTLRQRIYALAEQSQIALALPGGAGTLAEISFLWNHLIVKALPGHPLILIGAAWKATFDQFFTSLGSYVTARDQKLLTFAPDVKTAVELVNQAAGLPEIDHLQ
jgi:uncharacterized protein (TIGR00725 family)